MNALLYLTVVLIWGTTWIAITLQQEGPVAIPVSIAYRFAISAAVMFAVLLLTRRLRRLAPRDHLFCVLQGCCVFGFNFFCFYHAAAYISSGLESVIFSMAVLFNALNSLLFFRQRAVRQPPARVERQRPLLQQLRGAAVQFRPVQPMARFVQPVQHDVFRHRQRGDQRDVDLLLHHVNAVAARLQRGVDRHRLAVDQDLAAIMIVGAGEDRHQRRLARAVGADQRMD